MTKPLTLQTMIEIASDAAERTMQEHGAVLPMWYVQSRDGKTMLLTPPPIADKDMLATGMKMTLAAVCAARYVFVDEAWSVNAKTEGLAELRRWMDEHGSLQHHPNRIEMVIFSAEDDDGRTLTGERRIIRDIGKPPRLGPLKIAEPKQNEGRFVGLLPRKTALVQ